MQLRHVTLAQNLGQMVQVVNGVSADDRLVNNPPAALMDGQRVEPVTPMIDQAAALEKPKPISPPRSSIGDGHMP